MPAQDYAPRPAHLKWLLDSDPSIRWQVIGDLTDAAREAIAAQLSRAATEGWEPNFWPANSPWQAGRPPRRTQACSLPSLVLMHLGLEPAITQARKAVDRVDKHLIFKWHSNRRFFDGETEPCISGRILARGA
jgi:hypothetical protein